MSDKFDLEDELANSIAQIIEDETADAESTYKKNAGKKVTDTIELETIDIRRNNSRASKEMVFDEEDEDDEEDDEEKSSLSPKAKLIIILTSVLVAIGIIVGGAIFFVKSTIKPDSKGYGYYQNLAYEEKDNNKNYEKAIENFKLALNNKEELLKDKTIKINDKEVLTTDIVVKDMLNMRDCYVALNRESETIDLLYEVLSYDSINENAIYYLAMYYIDKENFEKLNELYKRISSEKDIRENTIKIFKKYLCAEPVITPAAGDYGKDITVRFSVDNDSKVYYTMDGTDPKASGTIFTDGISVKEGKTTVKYYITNKYGFSSEVYTAEYNISYKAPDAPKVTPESGSYTTSSEYLITISNIPSKGNAYYEISDGISPVKPTENSTKYTEPFPMPAGSSLLCVVVIDENGLSSDVVVNTYNLTITDKYDDRASEQLIWSALKLNNVINNSGKTKAGETLTISYNSKREIDGKLLWLFTVLLDGNKQKYLYACDANEGNIYKVGKNEDSGEFKLVEIKY